MYAKIPAYKDLDFQLNIIPNLTYCELCVATHNSQYGHLKGLPLGINITSAVPVRDLSI